MPGEDLVLGVVERALAPQVVEHARDAFAQAFRRDAEGVGVVLDPRQGGVEALVLHLHPSPGFEAERLPGRERDLAQHLEAQVLAALLGVASAAASPAATAAFTAAAFAPGHLPDLRDQGARERLVRVQQVVQPSGEVADRARILPDPFRHQRPQPETARVILHPAGLERGVLAVVAEHQQAAARGVVHHVLRQHVHVRHVDRPHRPGRLAVAAPEPMADGSAREAAREPAGVRLALADRVKLHRLPRVPAMEASGHRTGMRGAATAAEPQRRGAGMGRWIMRAGHPRLLGTRRFRDTWIPAFAGMTKRAGCPRLLRMRRSRGWRGGMFKRARRPRPLGTRRSQEGRGTTPRGGVLFGPVVLVVARADQAIDEDDAPTAERFVQRLPPGVPGAGFAAARSLAGEGEVLEKRDVVMLSAGGAGGDRETGVALAGRPSPFLSLARLLACRGFPLALPGRAGRGGRRRAGRGLTLALPGRGRHNRATAAGQAG